MKGRTVLRVLIAVVLSPILAMFLPFVGLVFVISGEWPWDMGIEKGDER